MSIRGLLQAVDIVPEPPSPHPVTTYFETKPRSRRRDTLFVKIILFFRASPTLLTSWSGSGIYYFAKVEVWGGGGGGKGGLGHIMWSEVCGVLLKPLPYL